MNGISTEHDGGAAASAVSDRRSQISPSRRSTSPHADQITDEQLVAAISAPEPRMAGLAISNDALRNSLRPAVPPSFGGWLHKTLVEPWWRYVEYGYTEAVCWLWARAPWQRWALSAGLGALLGLALVIVAARRFRAELESVAAVSAETVIASTQLAAASSMVIAPLRASAEAPPPVAVVKAEPVAVSDGLALPEPEAPSTVEVSEQLVEDPAAAQEPGKSKKGRHGHGRKRGKPKNPSKLSELFRSMHKTPRERGIQ
jgi:hypothetical protein